MRRQNYSVKRGLFKNQTFAISEDSFANEGAIVTTFGEFDSKEELMEHMIRQIIENGGKVVDDKTKSHYIVTEDGTHQKIWDLLGGSGAPVDNLNRKIVHFRWVTACIERQQMLDDNDQLHLLPLP